MKKLHKMLSVWQFSHGCRSSVVLCNAPLLSFAVLCNPLQYLVIPLLNRGMVGVSSLPKTTTRQRRGCDLNPGFLCLSRAR